jgi:hypothetical protein
MDRDPGSGRKMINQYVVLHELGHGTHGRVRLGQEVYPEAGDTEYGDATGPLYVRKYIHTPTHPRRPSRLSIAIRNESVSRALADNGRAIRASSSTRASESLIGSLAHSS